MRRKKKGGKRVFSKAEKKKGSVCCVCVTTKDTLYDMLVFQRIVLNLAFAYAYVYFLPVGPSGKKG